MRVCMITQDKQVKGGIAAVISGYFNSELEKKYNMEYIESYTDGNKLQKIIKGVMGYASFLKLLIINRPDLVHIHSSFGPSFYRKIPFILMSSWAKIPLINHIHGADFEEFFENASSGKQTLIKKIYNKNSLLIVLSEEWKLKLSKVVSSEKIRVIENFSCLNPVSLKQRLNRKSNNKILFLGELGVRKGCYDVPKVLENVVKEIPNATIIMAGKGTQQDEENIKSEFESLGLSQHVTFPGWVRGNEKDILLNESDLFYLPSHNEGMPMSILDAMGYGLPVVSTNVGGIPKLVKDGINGYCSQPGEIEQMSSAIIRILKGDLSDLMNNSYNIVEENYSLEKHLTKLDKVYLEFAGKK